MKDFVNTKLYKSSLSFNWKYLENAIVIAGCSGKFPNCNSIKEFEKQLYNQVDMVREDDRRWPFFHNEIPKRMGIIVDLEKFDAENFGMNDCQADRMDPQCRVLIELAHEAVFDAGIHPKSIYGTKTGVFIACQSDLGETLDYDKLSKNDYGVTGYSRAMLANRISYSMNLTGPSCVIDTACSGFLCAFDNAFRSIKYGQCDAALVGAANLLTHPHITLQFSRLGALSTEGYCKTFDKNASGYARSESICMVYLQKSKDAKRLYGTIINAKSNSDGYKSEGITYPSSKMQKELFVELYNEIGIDPSTIPYVEAHGTGTLVGDPVECDALDNAFCLFRTEPLLVGSVKSNMGHSEATSGICSVVKTIFTFENGIIPANLHFTEMRPEIPSLMEGRLKVCDKPTLFTDSLIGINSFGFGGSNTHALLQRNPKIKLNNGIPNDDLPRLVAWSGRTESAMTHFFDSIESQPLDIEFIGLLHNIQCSDDNEFNALNKFKGYGIYKYSPNIEHAICATRTIENNQLNFEKRPIVWIFGSPKLTSASQWTQWILPLLDLPIIKKSINEYHKKLSENTNINLMNIINFSNTDDGVNDDDDGQPKNELNTRIASIVIQICMINLLRMLDVEADYYIGHEVNQLCCAYADGRLTAVQTIALAESSYIDGNLKRMNSFTKNCEIKEKSKWLNYNNKNNNNKTYKNNNGQTINSESFYEEIIDYELPKNPLIIEICPNELFQNLSSKLLPNSIYVPLLQYDNDNSLVNLLKALGNIYIAGINIPIHKLYPPIRFPVARATPMISPLIKWDHTKDWYINKFEPEAISGHRKVTISLNDQDYEFIDGHTVDEKCLFPGTAYLKLVWETFALMNGKVFSEIDIEFENVRFVRATTVTKEQIIELNIMIHCGTGQFEITEQLGVVATGIVSEIRQPRTIPELPEFPDNNHLPFLNGKDFYKELHLRGYQYKGQFETVTKARIDGCYGYVKWSNNWIAFLDGILQLTILEYKCRTLLLPTRIDKIKIYTKEHMEYVSKLDSNKLDAEESILVDVKYYAEIQTLYAGGIEIFGKHTSPTARKKPPGFPVLEKYKFIAYGPTEKFQMSEAVRICVQIGLENKPVTHVKGIEIDLDLDNRSPIIQYVEETINDMPLITTDLKLYTQQKKNINFDKIQIEYDIEQIQCSNCFIVIGVNCLERPQFIETYVTDQTIYIISRENIDKNLQNSTIMGFQSLCAIPTIECETLILFQRIQKPLQQQQQQSTVVQKDNSKDVTPPTIIYITGKNNQYDWLETLQKSIKIGPVIMVSQNERNSGILGLVKCVRREPIKYSVMCFLIDDLLAPAFDSDNIFYKKQLNLGMAINVYRDGQWGTYVHLKLEQCLQENPRLDNCFASILYKGDLSTLNWHEGYDVKSLISGDDNDQNLLINVQCVALNSYDLIINDELITKNMDQQISIGENNNNNNNNNSQKQPENMLGYEYSGINRYGDRKMGLKLTGALATQIMPTQFIWNIPEKWSFEEAATVPASYLIVYAAYFIFNPIAKGKSILIHCGSDGIGLAAIRIAFSYGMEVYTTVSNSLRKTYLLEHFPGQLKDCNIGNSEDCSFERLIKLQTYGAGVDYILNCLNDDKQLHASIRCLCPMGGTFLHIDTNSLKNDTQIQLTNNILFYSITIDNIFKFNSCVKQQLIDMITNDLDNGKIQPICSKIFRVNELEKAFLCLKSNDSVGKILIKVRENQQDECSLPMKVLPKCYFDENLVYILIGGLGGFGMELTNWMTTRGARKIILCSRTGILKSYHLYRISIWESNGCKINVSTIDVTTRQGCQKLFEETRMQFGDIGGIFNLAMALKDSILENQTIEKFTECMGPKAMATTYFDELSREMCPQLKYFVVWSSLACGCGNAGQTNYGMANSVMERIVEYRQSIGLPAKAIQWGAIGEVGMVANLTDTNVNENFSGYTQQRISSCLHELDTLILSSDAIVVSRVVADKLCDSDEKRTLIDTILKIMGIRDIKSVPINATLSDMGMDSLVAIEIKQTLEREYQLTFTTQDLRSLTFSRIKELTDEKDGAAVNGDGGSATDNIRLKLAQEFKPVNLKVLLKNLWDEKINTKTLTRLQTRNNNEKFNSCIFIIPGIEGIAGSQWHVMATYINLPTFMLQLTDTIYKETPTEIVNVLIENIKHIINKIESFYLIGYSFGTLLSFEFVRALESKGISGSVILIDGSPAFLKRICYGNVPNRYDDKNAIENAIFHYVIHNIFPTENTVNIVKKLVDCKNVTEKIKTLIDYGKTETKYSGKYLEMMIPAFYNRLQMVANIDINNFKKIKNPITLIRPTEMSVTDIAEDYELSKFTDANVQLKFIEGNHTTMIENLELVQIINDIVRIG